MAGLKGHKVLQVAAGAFGEVVEHFPDLSYAIRSPYYNDDKKYYTGTSYTVSLYALAEGGWLGVLEVTESYTVEVGVGDGAVDYYDAEFYHKTCPVSRELLDRCGFSSGVTDKTALLSAMLSAEWSDTHGTSFSIESDGGEPTLRPETFVIPASVKELSELDVSLSHYARIEVAEGNTSLRADGGLIYSYDGAVLLYAHPSVSRARVADGTREIADAVFENSSITEIYLPDGLGRIGARCFEYCKEIEEITVPDTVTEIGDGAFAGCETLRVLHISDGVSQIAPRLCCGCCALESVNIPSGAVSVGHSAFAGCSSLVGLTLPRCLSDVYDESFARCSSLESVRFSGNARIAKRAFAHCGGLNTVEIDGALLGVGREAFIECEALEELLQHGGDVEKGRFEKKREIEYHAFYMCTSLRELVINGGIEKIGDFAFAICPSLERVELAECVAEIGMESFEACGSLETVELHAPYTDIFVSAFADCECLTRVHAGGDVRLWSEAFRDCTSLTEVYIDGAVYEIEEEAFKGCTSLTSFVVSGEGSIPEKYKRTVGESAFKDCSSLVNFSIPEGLAYIEKEAFSGCSSLPSVTLPRSVKLVERRAFADCTALVSAEFLADDVTVSLDAYVFDGCTSLRHVGFAGDMRFDMIFGIGSCPVLDSFVVKGTAYSLDESTFSGCPSLKGITKE